MDHIETCVIGAGVVGLAIGRELSRQNGDLIVVDRYSRYGEGVSSRNSEVIHAGIYYPAGSLKAEMCVRGKHLLYEYCADHSVGYSRLGKLIVATNEAEEAELAGIKQKAQANGVMDLEFQSRRQVEEMEPALSVTSALLSPSTGIVSSHDLMTSFLADIETAGGSFAPNTNVERIEPHPGGFAVHCDIAGESYVFSCSKLINSAGLGAQAVAGAIEGFDPDRVPPLYYCKGNYFLMSGKNPFKHLIYPVPDPSGAGLGVHATIDLGGQVKFGPDVEYIDREDYEVTASRGETTYDAIRRYFPGLQDGSLTPGYVGIRPKLQGPGEPFQDFMIQDESDHDMPGLVQLFGIESPGLTSSMAIAETVAKRFS